MKKILTLLLLISTAVILTSCGGSKEEVEKPKLGKILVDETLRVNLYNEVCFNAYKVEKAGEKYIHNREVCYFINVYDYPETEGITDDDDLTEIIKDTELSVFKTGTFYGFEKSDLDDDKDKEYGAPKYYAKAKDKTTLLPVCRVNDKDADLCISTDYPLKGGISERYAIIIVEDEEEE